MFPEGLGVFTYCCYLLTEVVVEYAFGRYTEAVEEPVHCAYHHRRAAHEVFDILRSLVVLEVGLIHNIMYKSGGVGHSGGICRRVRTVESEVELEVRELFLDLGEIFKIESFHEAARSIEEVHGAGGLHGLEEMHYVAAQRGHTGTAAHEDVFHVDGIILRQEELSERAADGDFVAGFAGEYIRGGDSGRHGQHLEHAFRLTAVERRRGDTHVELDDVLLRRIGSHRVGAYGGNGVLVLDAEETVFLPVAAIDGIHIDVGEVDVVLGDVDLDVFSGLELEMLAFGEPDGEFLDEGGHVLVGDNFALEFLDAQGGVGNRDLEIFLNLHLASETHAVLNLLAVEESLFGGEDLAAALEHLHLALAAVGLAAAGRGEEDLLVRQGVHQIASLGHLENLLSVVDIYGHLP